MVFIDSAMIFGPISAYNKSARWSMQYRFQLFPDVCLTAFLTYKTFQLQDYSSGLGRSGFYAPLRM